MDGGIFVIDRLFRKWRYKMTMNYQPYIIRVRDATICSGELAVLQKA